MNVVNRALVASIKPLPTIIIVIIGIVIAFGLLAATVEAKENGYSKADTCFMAGVLASEAYSLKQSGAPITSLKHSNDVVGFLLNQAMRVGYRATDRESGVRLAYSQCIESRLWAK